MDIGLNKRPIVISWEDLKLCMHARFVPPHYRKELLLKLQKLQQGTKSVDDYFKELQQGTKIDMHESEESKMARFVSGLRREIQDVVKLYEYSSLEKLVHLAIKVETQLSKKNHSKTFIMMATTNHLGKIKTKLLPKVFLQMLRKIPLTTLNILIPPLQQLSHLPKLLMKSDHVL